MASIAATLPLAGCSFLFVQRPHEEYGYRGVADCTTTRAAPIIDTIFTLTNIASAAYVSSDDNVSNKGTAVGVGVAVSALWLSSAIYGYYNANHCRELQRADYDDGPYHGPVRSRRLGGEASSIEPGRAPARPAAPAAQVTTPAGISVVPQQSDDDDPRRRRNGAALSPGLHGYPE